MVLAKRSTTYLYRGTTLSLTIANLYIDIFVETPSQYIICQNSGEAQQQRSEKVLELVLARRSGVFAAYAKFRNDMELEDGVRTVNKRTVYTM